jgi:hypothetical protein
MRLSISCCLIPVWMLLTATSQAQELAEKSNTDLLRETHLEWSRSPRMPLGNNLTQEPPVAEVDEGAPQQWSVLMRDKTLYRVFSRWAEQAKYQLIWQIDRDYPIESGVVFEGGFRGAVTEVMATVALTDYPLQAIFNPAARVLRVVRFMDEDRR